MKGNKDVAAMARGRQRADLSDQNLEGKWGEGEEGKRQIHSAAQCIMRLQNSGVK